MNKPMMQKGSFTIWAVGAVGSASDLHSEGQGFESLTVHGHSSMKGSRDIVGRTLYNVNPHGWDNRCHAGGLPIAS